VLLLADAAQASELGILGPAGEALAEAFWPGGLTLIVRQRGDTVPALDFLEHGTYFADVRGGLRRREHDARQTRPRGRLDVCEGEIAIDFYEDFGATLPCEIERHSYASTSLLLRRFRQPFKVQGDGVGAMAPRIGNGLSVKKGRYQD